MIKKALVNLYNQLSVIPQRVPRDIASNFSAFDPVYLGELEKKIIDNLLRPLNADHHLTKAGKDDIATHVHGRLNRFRSQYIPWIDHIRKLKGCRLLEVGCGTGASTQALSEQGAEVTGLDIDEKALDIARFRLTHTSQRANFVKGNATELSAQFKKDSFDCVIFFASLEHMTTDERISSLNQAYHVLKPGGALFVLEAPNRLWFYDMHTAFLPFYFWLPDDLAARYAFKSPRKLFSGSVNFGTARETLARWGRGVSYHEFELAGIPAPAISDASSLFDFQMEGNFLQKRLYRLNLNYKYKRIIRKIAPPGISSAFLEPFLELCIRK